MSDTPFRSKNERLLAFERHPAFDKLRNCVLFRNDAVEEWVECALHAWEESKRRENALSTGICIALKSLESDHVTNNKHRLGVLGDQDIGRAIATLKDALK